MGVVANEEQRFYSTAMLIAAPPFLLIWGIFMVAALSDKSGRQIGVFFTAVWAVALFALLRNPYVAVVRSDGSITFRALTRTITTSVDAISRISIRRGRAISYVFHFNDRTASLGWDGGQGLSRYVLERNPLTQGP